MAASFVARRFMSPLPSRKHHVLSFTPMAQSVGVEDLFVLKSQIDRSIHPRLFARLQFSHCLIFNFHSHFQGYLKKAQSRLEMFNAEQISTIFGNIEEIYNFSKIFLTDLEKQINHHRTELSEIGQCFFQHVCRSFCSR